LKEEKTGFFPEKHYFFSSKIRPQKVISVRKRVQKNHALREKSNYTKTINNKNKEKKW